VLKDFRNASIESVQLIEGGERKQVITAARPKLIDPPANVPRRARDGGAAPRSYNETDREDEALQLLAAALKTIDGASLRDYRHLLVGAELRRFFEIKAFAGDIRDEIRLEPSQLQRPSQHRRLLHRNRVRPQNSDDADTHHRKPDPRADHHRRPPTSGGTSDDRNSTRMSTALQRDRVTDKEDREDTADAAEYVRLPRDRTVIIGSRIELRRMSRRPCN
jgi:hypothetical protein